MQSYPSTSVALPRRLVFSNSLALEERVPSAEQYTEDDDINIMREHQNCFYPLTLYRVQYEGCKTQYDPVSDELRAVSLVVPHNEAHFIYAVNKHLDWRSKDRSPFISLFSDRRHAIQWGNLVLKKKWIQNKTFCLLEYRFSGPVAAIFSVAELKASLGVVTRHDEPADHEYLCLHRVPSSAFVDSSIHSLEDDVPGPSTRYNSPRSTLRRLPRTMMPSSYSYAFEVTRMQGIDKGTDLTPWWKERGVRDKKNDARNSEEDEGFIEQFQRIKLS
ncbi:hypothetical protein CPB86DRAFT_866016 [Serendipita vermifera]|nr:hypothetical protein CPB86DRAFT_866016 [Serendipita vermifera]